MDVELNTTHIILCKDTEKFKNEIEEISDLNAECVIKDPSLLNDLPKPQRKKTKSIRAGKVNLMIRSAGR